MIGIYDIILNGQPAGEAKVTQEGLYYVFSCQCHFADRQIYRLWVKCGSITENLGIPVPEGEKFLLQKKIPISRFADAVPEFFASLRNEEPGKFLPVKVDEPFEALPYLADGVLAEKDGEIGIELH